MTRSIVLSGFMATGKSTVGRLVADELGLPFVDSDELLASSSGLTVGALFAAEGEARFRDREAAAVLPLLSDGVARVLSFGGGTVTISQVRRAALEAATDALADIAASGELNIASAACAQLGRMHTSGSKGKLKALLESATLDLSVRVSAAACIAEHWMDTGDISYLEDRCEGNDALEAHCDVIKRRVYGR